jgi:hypothetical protein
VPFVLGAAPVVAVALALLGLVGGILAAAVVLAVFFAAYYTAYEPYRALYPDLVDDAIAGRAQSTQALFRGAATALALVGGGLLFSTGQPVPFVSAAVILLADAILMPMMPSDEHGALTGFYAQPRSGHRARPAPGRRGHPAAPGAARLDERLRGHVAGLRPGHPGQHRAAAPRAELTRRVSPPERGRGRAEVAH